MFWTFLSLPPWSIPFPKQDLYLLVQEIGPEDAFPLLALSLRPPAGIHLRHGNLGKGPLCSGRHGAVGCNWFLSADSARLIPWLVEHKTEFLELFLFKSIEVRIREHDQDPSDFGSGYITHDDVFYVRVLDPVALGGQPPDPEDPRVKARQEVIFDLLQRLALWDHPKYQAILLEAMSVIPAEIEEEEYRLRNVRLAEKGFLPFDEAIGIYQPLEPQALEGRLARRLQTGEDPLRRFQVPGRPVDWVDPESLFAGALEQIEPGEILYRFRPSSPPCATRSSSPINARCGTQPSCPRRSKKFAATFPSASTPRPALHRIRPGRPALIRRYPLADIFRVGFGRALALRWRAERWLKESWFRTVRIAPDLLGRKLDRCPRRAADQKDPSAMTLPAAKRCIASSRRSKRSAWLPAVLDDVIAVDGVLAEIEPRLEASVSRRRRIL